MTGLEKKQSKKAKKNKKKNKAEESGDVLERVMDSIEMAGASLDFFEENSDGEPKIEEVNSLDPEQKALEEALVASQAEPTEETETLEASQVEPSVETETLEASDDESPMEAKTDEENAVDAMADEDQEIVEKADDETLDAQAPDAQSDEQLEASTPETSLDIDEDTETIDMLQEDEEAEFIEQSQAFSIIESLLFSSDRPLGLGTFKQVFKGTQFKTKDIKKALEEMQSVYADASRGVMLEEINGGWQLRTKVDNMDFLRKLAKARPFKLSGPALEVLAIIAYKQPLVKSEVDQIRGVESGHLVRALMEKHLVSFQGKSELPGKPMQYGTTRKFLEIFGLRNLRELPSLDEIDQLLPDGIGLEEEEEKLSDVTDKMSEDYAGNYSEGEEELSKIQDTLEAIDTSSEFFEEEKRREKERRDRDRARDIREALDVGEDVESKDQKWLLKYDERIEEEARLAAEAEEAAANSPDTDDDEAIKADGTDVAEEVSVQGSDVAEDEAQAMDHDELIAPGHDITDGLSALSAESLVAPEVLATDAELEEQEEQDLDPFADIEPEKD